ncbi:MAG: hypothetical protein LBQ83_03015 [Candidatus Margulisbacteria bacterium]|jgi:hypothetical protein|nr:hypothetical protein [Candidatus Margulisiibacteriota bacterium]
MSLHEIKHKFLYPFLAFGVGFLLTLYGCGSLAKRAGNAGSGKPEAANTAVSSTAERVVVNGKAGESLQLTAEYAPTNKVVFQNFASLGFDPGVILTEASIQNIVKDAAAAGAESDVYPVSIYGEECALANVNIDNISSPYMGIALRAASLKNTAIRNVTAVGFAPDENNLAAGIGLQLGQTELSAVVIQNVTANAQGVIMADCAINTLEIKDVAGGIYGALIFDIEQINDLRLSNVNGQTAGVAVSNMVLSNTVISDITGSRYGLHVENSAQLSGVTLNNVQNIKIEKEVNLYNVAFLNCTFALDEDVWLPEGYTGGAYTGTH